MPENDDTLRKIDYKVDYRNIKYPRLEFKTGNLILILPTDYKKENTILDKHQKWINHKEKIIKRALKEAENRKLNTTRTDEELKQLINTIIANYKKEANILLNPET